MNFQKAKNAVKTLLIASVLACVVSFIFSDNGTPVSAYAIIIALGLLVMSFIVAYNFCKCPYCGKHILIGMLTVKDCPKCHRNLITGERKKGKGGKRVKH